MKDEMCSVAIAKFVEFKPKMKSVLLSDFSEYKVRGVNKNVAKVGRLKYI